MFDLEVINFLYAITEPAMIAKPTTTNRASVSEVGALVASA